MLFNSFEFLLFFPITTTLYFLMPHKWRWLLLLISSCIFYMAFVPQYILILFFVVIIDYTAAIYIERSSGKKRKLYLILSVVSTCSVLFVFKYFNFFNSNVAAFAEFFDLRYPIGLMEIMLPIGLSFHTFQSLSYVIEVYRGEQKAEKHIGMYSLYVMFYPQLVAGPIERPQNLLHQFYQKHKFDYGRVTDGLKLMAWGMFKKVVIANRLSIPVSMVFDNPHDYTGISFIVAIIFFAFQIYCDFSGYSDIAIGTAQVLGIRLMNNFNRPYFARSVAEFWKRWHISLSTWFKDYVYIPLGGSRVGTGRLYFNLMVTFLISGLWHGANWTYVLWGALNGAYMIVGMMTKKIRNNCVALIKLDQMQRVHNYIRVVITFSLICFSWIFFRAQTIDDAFFIVSQLFNGVPEFFVNLIRGVVTFSISNELLQPITFGQMNREVIAQFALIGFLLFFHKIQSHGSIRHMLAGRPAWFRWSMYYTLVGSIFVSLLLEKNYQEPFIYFQF